MEAFDPLSYENLGASVARALDDQPVFPLSELSQFDGAGVYMLFYSGDFEPYARLSEHNRETPGSWPIYIGKAEAEKSRKGDPNQRDVLDGPKLFKRMNEHRRSIVQAENLDIEDFSCKSLVVAPAWVQLAEIIAIRMHQPLWNSLLDGFGNHAPGSGRASMVRPRWDTLHPGRSWASVLGERAETVDDVIVDVEGYLEMNEPEHL